MAFSKDGKVLATAGADRAVRLWDVANGQSFRTLQGHTDTINCLAFRRRRPAGVRRRGSDGAFVGPGAGGAIAHHRRSRRPRLVGGLQSGRLAGGIGRGRQDGPRLERGVGQSGPGACGPLRSRDGRFIQPRRPLHPFLRRRQRRSSCGTPRAAPRFALSSATSGPSPPPPSVRTARRSFRAGPTG